MNYFTPISKKITLMQGTIFIRIILQYLFNNHAHLASLKATTPKKFHRKQQQKSLPRKEKSNKQNPGKHRGPFSTNTGSEGEHKAQETLFTCRAEGGGPGLGEEFSRKFCRAGGIVQNTGSAYNVA